MATTFHPDDHKPDWTVLDPMDGMVGCWTCRHYAQTFKCATCGEMADESTVGHGTLRTGTHYPIRKTSGG